MSAKLGIQRPSYGDRRSTGRSALNRTGILRIDGDAASETLIADLTRDGCRLVTNRPLARGRIVEIGLAGVGSVEARIIWQGSNGYGCEFLVPLPPGAVTAATQNNVLAISTGTPSRDSERMTPETAKLPGWQRLAIILGIAAAGWTVVIAAYAVLS